MAHLIDELNLPKITLLHHTSLDIASTAIRTCWNSHDKSDKGGDIDKELILRVGNKNKHASTLEHLNYTFYIKGVSRALLQELARHRHASLSVKSSRYTLKELRRIDDFDNEHLGRLFQLFMDDLDLMDKSKDDIFTPLIYHLGTISQYIYISKNELVFRQQLLALCALQKLIKLNLPNDEVKYILPECYKTELTYSINARALQQLIYLRTGSNVLPEFRTLVKSLYNVLPSQQQYLFTEFIQGD